MKAFIAALPVIRKYWNVTPYLLAMTAGFCIALPWAALMASAMIEDLDGYVRNSVYGGPMACFAVTYVLLIVPRNLLFPSRCKNDAGQEYFCIDPVSRTVQHMEQKLRDAAVTASRPMATPEDKEAFRALAEEVERDFALLAPALRMKGTESFRFNTAAK